jgi:hypothetical protein
MPERYTLSSRLAQYFQPIREEQFGDLLSLLLEARRLLISLCQQSQRRRNLISAKFLFGHKTIFDFACLQPTVSRTASIWMDMALPLWPRFFEGPEQDVQHNVEPAEVWVFETVWDCSVLVNTRYKRQHVLPKSWYAPTKPHSTITQNITVSYTMLLWDQCSPRPSAGKE